MLLFYGFMSLGLETQTLGLDLEHMSLGNKCCRRNVTVSLLKIK